MPQRLTPRPIPSGEGSRPAQPGDEPRRRCCRRCARRRNGRGWPRQRLHVGSLAGVGVHHGISAPTRPPSRRRPRAHRAPRRRDDIGAGLCEPVRHRAADATLRRSPPRPCPRTLFHRGHPLPHFLALRRRAKQGCGSVWAAAPPTSIVGAYEEPRPPAFAGAGVASCRSSASPAVLPVVKPAKREKSRSAVHSSGHRVLQAQGGWIRASAPQSRPRRPGAAQGPGPPNTHHPLPAGRERKGASASRRRVAHLPAARAERTPRGWVSRWRGTRECTATEWPTARAPSLGQAFVCLNRARGYPPGVRTGEDSCRRRSPAALLGTVKARSVFSRPRIPLSGGRARVCV